MPPAAADALRTRFASTFGPGPAPRVVRAPGRVNLIGEHTDYNDGFVFPMAIEPHVLLAFRPRTDGHVHIASTSFPDQTVSFSLNHPITTAPPTWGNYGRGVAHFLTQHFGGHPLTGIDALIDNTLPVGAGLSSSAAIEVATARALLLAAGQTLDPWVIAKLCQQAEWHFAHVPCGIMDQAIVAAGTAGHAMLLDCRSLAARHVPLPSADLRVVIANSMVRHELSGGEYAHRKAQCQQAVAYFNASDSAIKSLRDVTPAHLESARGQLADLPFRRARHVVTEIARTTAAAAALESARYTDAGQLMNASHASLRDDYEVSCPELDLLAKLSTEVPGVYGARMTGGGFGGCIVALTTPAAVERLTAHLKREYPKQYKATPDIFVTTATQGAGEI